MAKSKFVRRLGVVSAVILGIVGVEEAATKLLKGAPLLVNAAAKALHWDVVSSDEVKLSKLGGGGEAQEICIKPSSRLATFDLNTVTVTVTSKSAGSNYTITKKDKEGVCVRFVAYSGATEWPASIAGYVTVNQTYGG